METISESETAGKTRIMPMTCLSTY